MTHWLHWILRKDPQNYEKVQGVRFLLQGTVCTSSCAIYIKRLGVKKKMLTFLRKRTP